MVRLALEALIARKSARRLAKLGGAEKKLETIPRRRAEFRVRWLLLTRKKRLRKKTKGDKHLSQIIKRVKIDL